jgi:LysM repeat protein
MLKKILLLLINSLSLSVCYAAESDSGISFTDSTPTVVSAQSSASGVRTNLVKSTAPRSYTVKKTDTVMKLAEMYLKKISYWSQFMGVSRFNATKLYPGDQLQILGVDGYKVLVVSRGNSSSNSPSYEKLVPTARDIDSDALPPMSIRKLRNMLMKPTLVDQNIFESLPVVVGGGEVGQYMYTAGDNIYVKGLTEIDIGSQVSVLSKFREIVDPDSKESLGYEVHWDGTAILDQLGPVSTLHVNNTVSQISPLDRIMSVAEPNIPVIVPHKSDQIISGKIVALYDSLTSTAEDNTVVINRGARDGVDVGLVFDITSTRKIVDPTSNQDKPKYLIIPPEIIGEVIVYKVYDKLSFGLVTDSNHAIELYSVVQSQE